MDPLTRAAQEFVRQLAEAWRGTAPVRLVAPADHRTHVVRSLRVFEWMPDNRWPLCLIEPPAGDVEAAGEAALERVAADVARLQRGFAEEGMVLEVPPVAEAGDCWRRLQRFAAGVGEALARTGAVAGLAIALVPQGDRRTRGWIAERLQGWPESPWVRVALWCEGEELAAVLPAAARFVLDEEALIDFCREQTERQIASEPPDVAMVHRHLLVASEAARRGDTPAAKQGYEAASTALEQQGRLAEAAVVQIALGGLSFGLGEAEAALGYFDRAAAHGEATGLPAIGSQAQLGAAGCLFAGRAYAEAAARYRVAARSGTEALCIEALRMAGVCHAELGERELAALAWQDAVDRAAGLPAHQRRQTSWKQAGEALLELLDRRGLTEQCEHLRSVLDGAEAGRAAGS